MRLLVIRTSAMGDVALTAPVISDMRNQYPDVELVLFTRAVYKPFFSSIKGLLFFFPDFKERHKALPGIIRLYRDIIKQGRVDYVIDLHDVLRSKILRVLFRLSGVRVAVFNKGRRDKKALLRGEIKSRLQHSVERYYDVFTQAGFPLTPAAGPWIIPGSEAVLKAVNMTDAKGLLNIGVAPYAKHELKMWPEDNMLRLLQMIAEKHDSKFWLFGGADESERLNDFQSRLANSVNLAGQLALEDELALMSKLDIMIAMDSSNMHMAALCGTKVISIWGGTDPVSGFGAWKQPQNYSVSISSDELSCRPCTTYGKGKCRRGDFACMNWLTPELVFRRIDDLKLL